MNFSEWILYLAVVLLSTLSPGPAVVLSMSNAVSQGRRAAAYSSLGNIAGLFVLSGAAFLGIGAALQASNALFQGLKIAGAAYLIYLGIRKWRSDERPADSALLVVSPRGPHKLILQGWLLAVTNPKSLLFFSALLPQFVHTREPMLAQFLSLTITLMLASFAALMGYAALAVSARKSLTVGHRIKLLNRALGAVFVLLGLGMLRFQGVAA
jgi:homoserine/homoserine lactone efflux protein